MTSPRWSRKDCLRPAMTGSSKSVVPNTGVWSLSTWTSATLCVSIHRAILESPFSDCRSNSWPATCSTRSALLPSGLPIRPLKASCGSCNEGASGSIIWNRKVQLFHKFGSLPELCWMFSITGPALAKGFQLVTGGNDSESALLLVFPKPRHGGVKHGFVFRTLNRANKHHE